MASTGFAGGLAAGFGAGVNAGGDIKMMGIRQGLAGLEAEKGARDAEEHNWKKEDRDAKSKWKSPIAETLMMFRTDGSGQPMDIAAPQQSSVLLPATERPTYGFAAGGLIQATDDVFAGRQAPSSMGGLTSAPQPQQPQRERLPDITPDNVEQELTRQMLTTDLLDNPDKLSKLTAVAEANGMGDKFKPFLERAYTAKKKGLIDGGMQLMRGQVDEAIDSLAKGGIKLEDRPTPADPKNPRMWKINISGAGEKVMDIGDLLQTTLDVDKFLKHDMDKNESEGKRNLSDARVDREKSMVRVNNARVGKLGEETKKIREGVGEDGDITKLPSQAALAEWMFKNGVAKSKPEAWEKVKTLADKSPSAVRQDMIEASMKNGLSASEAAKDIDSFLAQSGQGAPSPKSGAVRKYNPRTGGFD